jgi:NTP pyrophosphatase (non-canonical NTP hydrolase)
MDFKKLIDETLKVRDRFGNKLGRKNRFIDLVEEVGELANAMLLYDKVKPDKYKKGTKDEIADAFVDIMYNVILLADHYKVDLDEEYLKMLKSLQKRADERREK